MHGAGMSNEAQLGEGNQIEGKLMTSLDVRIFMVTIFLSVVLLAVSVTELLCCFRIIQDVASLAEWKFLLYYLLSEQFPSITIACFFKTDGTAKVNLGEGEETYNNSQMQGAGKDNMKGGYRRAVHNTDYTGGNEIY